MSIAGNAVRAAVAGEAAVVRVVAVVGAAAVDRGGRHACERNARAFTPPSVLALWRWAHLKEPQPGGARGQVQPHHLLHVARGAPHKRRLIRRPPHQVYAVRPLVPRPPQAHDPLPVLPRGHEPQPLVQVLLV
eukprot:3414823-Pyramimonas_sp.AAC.1